MVPTYSQKKQNKKKKRGVGLYQKLVMAPTKTKTKRKKKKEKKIGCLLLSLCFQTLHSSSSKLSTFQALSSLNPNAQLAGDGMTTKGVWGRWVGRMREVDGLAGGRVVGFRFVGELHIVKEE